jgi:alkaline phosphatase D
MLDQDLDFVVHVGDYIYEYGTEPGAVREVPDGETMDLAGYRRRYALYRLDADLQDAHAAYPFLVTFDDHEVENNYAGDKPEDGSSSEAFLQRRAAAYQAYFEHMPLALPSGPRDSSLRLFRRFQYSNLADLHLLDTRQYRSDQPCGDGLQPICADVLDPEATLFGQTQESWLLRGLHRSQARWNVLAQQIMMTRWDLGAAVGAPVPFFNMDAWDGYPAARNRLLSFIAEREVRNAIVLTGDIHSAWQADLKANFDDPSSRTVATEFVGTSISSVFPPEYIPLVEATLPHNPHINFFDGLHRGYIKHEVTTEAWRAEYYGVANPADPESEVHFLAAFSVADGLPGAVMD